MSVETINTLVVGAGQAGVAMSEHLSLMGVPHIVLERSRIAERWRSERWDSLVANGLARPFSGDEIRGHFPRELPAEGAHGGVFRRLCEHAQGAGAHRG